MLKAEFPKWLFYFIIIKLRTQLRYHRMNNNPKCDTSFVYADAWHASQNRTFRKNFWSSRTLKMCKYHSPWATEPVLCPFLSHWIYFWIVVRESGLICVWQIQLWPCLSVKDIDEIASFLKDLDAQREFPQFWSQFYWACDFSGNKLKFI